MALRRLPLLMVALLFVDFIDEFAAGMPTIGVPGIQADFELRYSMAAFIVFTGPVLVSWLLEPPLFLLADRGRKKLFVCGGLAAMGLLDVIVGLAGSFYVVAGALLLSATASGAGVSLSQATLMDLYPADRERVMSRWVLMGAAGDMAAPALFWLLGAFALGWREAFLASGALILVYAAFLVRQPFPESPVAGSGTADLGEELGTYAALRAAFRDRQLLLWLFAAWLCNLMDEILVAFGALHLRDTLGADSSTRAWVLMCFMGGTVVGLLVLGRLLDRFAPIALLRLAAVATGAAYTGWLFATSALESGLWLFVTGLFAGSLYPLAKAQAYRALPGRSGMLNAMTHVFTPLDALLPLALGLVADRFGILPALVVLLLQPIGLFAIAATRSRDAASP